MDEIGSFVVFVQHPSPQLRMFLHEPSYFASRQSQEGHERTRSDGRTARVGFDTAIVKKRCFADKISRTE